MRKSLFIQKVCRCCNKDHLNILKQFLISKNQKLPAELIKTLILFPEKDQDFYIEKIYQDFTEENAKKFNQLTHHTLKYFSFLSRNFPSFLWSKLEQIEIDIFNQEIPFDLIDDLITVAEKFEAFKLQGQLHSIITSNKELSQYFKHKIADLLKAKADFTSLIDLLDLEKEKLDNYKKSGVQPEKKELLQIKELFNSSSNSIQLLSKQVYLNLLSHCNIDEFYNIDSLDLIQSTIKLSEKIPYLSIAIYTERFMSLDYLLVKHTRLGMNEKEIHKICSQIIKKWQQFHLNDKELNVGLTLSLSIKGSHYITTHYLSIINKSLQKEITELSSMCNTLLNDIDWTKEGSLKHINLINVYAIYLILENEPNKASKIIEKILHEYQQVNFQKMYDGIFVILIMAYYQDKNYEMVVDSFNRYKKITKGVVSVYENDLIIKGLYYCSQLVLKRTKQYSIKIDTVIAELTKNTEMKNNLELMLRAKQAIG